MAEHGRTHFQQVKHTNQTKQTMKTLLCILIVTSSAANWYFGYTVGLSCGQSANATPPPARPVQKPKTKPAKPSWRELDGDSLLPVRDEYADMGREELESLLLFGNENVRLNLSRRR